MLVDELRDITEKARTSVEAKLRAVVETSYKAAVDFIKSTASRGENEAEFLVGQSEDYTNIANNVAAKLREEGFVAEVRTEKDYKEYVMEGGVPTKVIITIKW